MNFKQYLEKTINEKFEDGGGVTSDFGKFGNREWGLARDLINAKLDQGLPEDFNDDEVTIVMNTNSGNVFLTNSDYQVAMMNGDKLESFYSLPYGGEEGFKDDLAKLDPNSLNQEDIEYLKGIGVELKKAKKTPKGKKEPEEKTED